MKKCINKIVIASILAGIPILPSIAIGSEKEICEEKDIDWNPIYSKSKTGAHNIDTACNLPKEFRTDCKNTLNTVETQNEEFKKAFRANCTVISENTKKVTTEASDLNMAEANLQFVTSAETGVKSIISAIDTAIEKSFNAAKTNNEKIKSLYVRNPSLSSEKNTKNITNRIEAAIKDAGADKTKLDQGNAKTINSSISSSVTNPDIKGQVIAVGQSFDFVRQMLKSKKDFNTALGKIGEAKTAAQKIVNDLKTAGQQPPPGSETPTTPGKGFDPSSLLSLAPLAAMLAQRQPAATPEDPFQSGITQNAPPAPLPAAKLNGKSGSAETKPPVEEPKPEQSGPSAPSPYADAFTGEEETPSDITKGNLGGSLGGSGAGVSAAGGAGGGGGSSSDSNDAKGRSAASNPATEEALQGFGGGGGLNFGGGSSNSSSTALESVADPMKDMFSDMEQSLEGGGGFEANLGENGEGEQAADDVLMADSESLFPRVRACHSRALKKGWVLNGLGEKLSELDE